MDYTKSYLMKKNVHILSLDHCMHLMECMQLCVRKQKEQPRKGTQTRAGTWRVVTWSSLMPAWLDVDRRFGSSERGQTKRGRCFP